MGARNHHGTRLMPSSACHRFSSPRVQEGASSVNPHMFRKMYRTHHILSCPILGVEHPVSGQELPSTSSIHPGMLMNVGSSNDGLMKILILLHQMHIALPLLCDLSDSLVLLMPGMVVKPGRPWLFWPSNVGKFGHIEVFPIWIYGSMGFREDGHTGNETNIN